MTATGLNKKLASEFLGTLFLLAVVVGSGIMAERLSQGNAAIALLANSIVSGLGLSILILVFDEISGAHFNPLVTFIGYFNQQFSKKEVLLYILAQLLGAICGVLIAHLMFGETALSISNHQRSGVALMLSEFVATFGFIMVSRGVGQNHKASVPFAVGAYIASAYWFTASTSFANPAVTIARVLTLSATGIRSDDVIGFVVAQIFGAIAAEITFRWFFKKTGVAK